MGFDANDVTSQISEVGPFRAEDNAGDQHESTDQQKGEKVEHDQESQQHKEGLDAAAKVPWGTKVLFNRHTENEQQQRKICLRTQTHLQSTAVLFPTVRRNRGIL